MMRLFELLLVVAIFTGAILAVLGGLLALAASRYQLIGDFKTCPYCAERIRAAAIICRYCQRELPTTDFEKKPPKGLFQ